MTAHIPVDRFDIVNGPGATKWVELQAALVGKAGSSHPYVEALLTLKTLASGTSFRRTLKMATIFNVKDGVFEFTAIFNDFGVSGVYNMKSRTGWFSLD